ncbi:MAG TPA: hypothetical protein VFH47_04025, partial [Candidatus Thermoplasmatota archaeon]|nr:hypothetical protein [Candidatus Thermoplasmatota archaeon]
SPVQPMEPVQLPGASRPTAATMMAQSSLLVDRHLTVAPGEYEDVAIEVEDGDRVRGLIRASAPLDVFIMDEATFADFCNTFEPGDAECWLGDEASAAVDWEAPEPGVFHVVFDVYQKRSVRDVQVTLRRLPSRR